ncbi:PREDICTED: lipid transfer-like protein VAS [Populus euphratica]|uniref:Lipid transfer-like protein VAS n=1 Tax=Populus euphratica TaxID=75702 RepID=A0AAJ6Y033_POPEU|nr:PREDICTED: lipid transfer-like protein VAS [Populus euphratica]
MDKLLSCFLGISSLMMFVLLQDGNAQDTSCLNQLVPCLSYLNGTRDVPDTCCDPLKTVIKSNPKCLCNLASNQGSNQAEQAGINVTEAQELPGRCGLHVNPLSCLTGKNNSPNSKNSVDDSASIFLLPSWSLIVATTLSFTSQFL